MTNVNRARHRAACRPITPLDDLVTSRGLAAAAGTGVALTMAALPAVAAPLANPGIPQADVSGVSEQAQAALSVNPAVVVAPNASWSTADEGVSVKVDNNTTTTERTEERAQERTAPASRDRVREEPKVSEAPPATSGGVIGIALRYVGVPYVYGGSTPRGFDCSGFTGYVFAQVGKSLPRSSHAQGRMGTRISAGQARPGDLLYWSHGHVGIYMGGGKMIHSPRPGKSVSVVPIYGSPSYIRL